MIKKLSPILVLLGLLITITTCTNISENQINYIECSEEVINLLNTIDSQYGSHPEKLKQKILRICKNYGFQDLDEFKAAINKYEKESQKEELLNALKQITSDTSIFEGDPISSIQPHQEISDFLKHGGKAISLKILQKKLKENYGKPLTKSFSQFCGMNRIFGYVVDEVKQDIILVGNVDKTLPPLHLDDFVIALRNAWFKYAELKGNTYYYSHPGCTIDPDPAVLKKLDDVGNQMNQSQQTSGVEKAISQWEKICNSPQKVGVFGVPFDTRFGWVMVKADYDMKNIVDGSDQFDIPGFSSLIDMELQQAKEDIQQGRPISIQISGMNRFWFYPGKNQYQMDKDENLLMIEKCPVVLLTEEEHLTKSGKIMGSGRPNPYALKFTEKFSALYSKIATQRPIYQELENLFRFVAVARILKLKSPHKKVGLDFDFLLNQYPLISTPNKKYLPGRSNVKGFKHQTNSQDGSYIHQLWIPSCGGVTIAIEPKKEDFIENKTDSIAKLKENVLNAQPSSDELSWDFPGEPGGYPPGQTEKQPHPVPDQTISVDLIPLLKENLNINPYSNYLRSIYGI